MKSENKQEMRNIFGLIQLVSNNFGHLSFATLKNKHTTGAAVLRHSGCIFAPVFCVKNNLKLNTETRKIEYIMVN